MQLSNTTAHQGRLKEGFAPPIPVAILAEAKGRTCSPTGLAQTFSRALFPRTTNRYGGVTLPSYHLYVEEGLPKTQVLLWGYGEQLRAMCATVVLAEYHCRYDWQAQHVKDIRDGMFYATQFASPQAALIPLHGQESLVLYRPKPRTRQTRLPVPTPHLWLCELVSTA
jgi:hypothetical protein